MSPIASDLSPETRAAVDRLLRLQLMSILGEVEDRIQAALDQQRATAPPGLPAGLDVYSALGRVAERASGLQVIGARVERDHRTGFARIVVDTLDTTTLLIPVDGGAAGNQGHGIITYPGVIESWYMIALPYTTDVTISLSISKATFDLFPVMTEISGLPLYRPQITADVKGQGADLSGWLDVNVLPRDVIEAEVATGSATDVLLGLTIRREPSEPA